MPLILAVEPDRKQADAVATLARTVLRSEVVVTDSADAAIAIMAKRTPDLLLTSLLLPPKDEARIAERLRELDAAGSYVQTLVIPMLAVSGKKASDSKRRLWSRARNSAPDACAPEVFAGQISEYLRRAAVESVSRGGAVKADLTQDASTAATGTTGHLEDDAVPHRGKLLTGNVGDAGHVGHGSLLLDAAGTEPTSDVRRAAAVDAAASKQLHADRHSPKRRSSPAGAAESSQTGGASDLIKPGYASKPSAGMVQHEAPRTVIASDPTERVVPVERPAKPTPPKPPQRVVAPEPRKATLAERLNRLAAPKPRPDVVIAPEPPRTSVEVAGRASHVPPAPPEPPVVSPVESHPRSAAPVIAPAQTVATGQPNASLPPKSASQPPTNAATATVAASGIANQPNARVVEEPGGGPPSASENQPHDRNATRPMLVLGALDLGAFVEELTAAKTQAIPALAAQQNTAPTTPPESMALPNNPHAIPAPTVAEPPPSSSNGPATQADRKSNGRPQAGRRAVQDEWGIFDPQQAGFAALFAKLEEITDQEDSGKDPPK